MPVVRELVNRISFKVNPADKKNTIDTIDKIDKSIAKSISRAKLLGKVLGASIVLGVGIGAKKILDFRKEISETNFFARTREEAEALNEIFAKIAEDNEFISRVQAQQGAATTSQLNISIAQVKKLAPLLAEIDLVRKKLDFQEVSGLVSEAVKGDLNAFKNLIPGFKNIAELIEKAGFSGPFGDLTQEQRAKILLDNLAKSEGRLKQLTKGAKEDLQFQVDVLQAQTSDLFLEVGEKTENAMTESVRLAADLIKALRESEPFWRLIGDVSDSIVSGIKALRGIAKEISTNIKDNEFEGFSGAFKGEKPLTIPLSSIIENIKEAGILRSLERTKKRVPTLEEIKEDFREDFEESKGFLEKIKEEGILRSLKRTEEGTEEDFEGLKGFLKNFKERGIQRSLKRSEETKKLNISLNGTIRIEGPNGAEIAQMSSELTKKIFNEIKSGFNNIYAQNGGTNVRAT